SKGRRPCKQGQRSNRTGEQARHYRFPRYSPLAPRRCPMTTITLDPGRLTLAQLRSLWSAPAAVAVNGAARAAIDASSAAIARLAALLIGEGSARIDGKVVDAPVALREAGIAPLELAPKEGLALLNGTQVSTAIALAALFATERATAAAFVAGALSVDACLGSDTPFDARIQAVRGHPRQLDAARVYGDLLAGSAIRASHVDCPRVQDPYL